jgi:NNP family nitrate/nitrite transporter-like MFS transporter
MTGTETGYAQDPRMTSTLSPDVRPGVADTEPVSARSRRITDWEPEDAGFWERTGRHVARRNLIFSVLSEHLAFSVWAIWSVLVVVAGTHPRDFPFLDPSVAANAPKIFWLIALPNLIGAILRVPYTLAVGRLGGRTWTTISSVLLLIPIAMATWCVTHPGTPYGLFVVAAATAGLGGGNFASSMANIAYFFPERRKGVALGVNAAGGNIGLSTMQLVVPLVVFFGLGLPFAASVWAVPVLIATYCAWRFMDNLDVARQSPKDQFSVVRRPHAWVMSFLYIGTFGSFLGLSAAFPAVMAFEFPTDQKFHAFGTGLLLPVAFLGPLIGSLARPFGGWIADRVGGAAVTSAVFALMAAVAFGAISATHHHSLGGFVAAMLVMFALAGTGNGSAYRMIPAIFRRQAVAAANGDAEVERAEMVRARRTGSATIGMAGAFGALGGFILPKVIGNSIKATGGVGAAFSWFIGLYIACLIVTLVVYVRRGTVVSGV